VDEQVAGLVAQTRRKVVKAIADLGGEQEAFTPAEGEWSLPEILEHLFLAEQAGISRGWHAAPARQSRPAWDGDLPHHGRGIDGVIEETWAIPSSGPGPVRTTEDAPPAAVPRLRGPLGNCAACRQAAQRIYQPPHGTRGPQHRRAEKPVRDAVEAVMRRSISRPSGGYSRAACRPRRHRP